MRITKKCTNLDCKDYNLEHTVSAPTDPLEAAYCTTCLIGKMSLQMVGDHPSIEEQEELIVADFDIRKIFHR